MARAGLKAVLFDVDFTLARPGPELGAEGYVRAGQRCGLELDAALYEEARDRARDGPSVIRSSSTTRRSGSPSPSGS